MEYGLDQKQRLARGASDALFDRRRVQRLQLDSRTVGCQRRDVGQPLEPEPGAQRSMKAQVGIEVFEAGNGQGVVALDDDLVRVAPKVDRLRQAGADGRPEMQLQGQGRGGVMVDEVLAPAQPARQFRLPRSDRRLFAAIAGPFADLAGLDDRFLRNEQIQVIGVPDGQVSVGQLDQAGPLEHQDRYARGLEQPDQTHRFADNPEI